MTSIARRKQLIVYPTENPYTAAKMAQHALPYSSSLASQGITSCSNLSRRNKLCRELTRPATWIAVLVTFVTSNFYWQYELTNLKDQGCAMCNTAVQIRCHEENFAAAEKQNLIADFHKTRDEVLKELHALQTNRSKTVHEITKFNKELADTKLQIEGFRETRALEKRQLDADLEYAHRKQKESQRQLLPIAGKITPSKMFLQSQISVDAPSSSRSSLFTASFGSNFDFSRCPLFGPFQVSGDQACVFLQPDDERDKIYKNSNFITFDPTNTETAATRCSNEFKLNQQFRQHYDLVVPINTIVYPDEVSLLKGGIKPPTPFSPAMRKNLLAYCENPSIIDQTEAAWLKSNFLDDLRTIPLETANLRAQLSGHTFLVIPAWSGYTSSTGFVNCLKAAFLYGSIPVILEHNSRYQLPFGEYIDYTQSTVRVHAKRHPEVVDLLRQFSSTDMHHLRRSGFFVYQTYFQSLDVVKQAILATIRQRIHIPHGNTPGIDELKADVVNHQSYQLPPGFPHLKVYNLDKEILDELVNVPRETKRNSAVNYRLYARQFLESRSTWNMAPGPLQFFGSDPYEPPVPSDERVHDHGETYSIVGVGEGGYGETFQKQLGGNRRREQFTVVMLTYDRNEVLIESLKRLDALPFLNKVVVVWNNPEYPGDDLQWPDIGVEIVVIKAKKNSLNNRFFPYSEIETDAVLHLDDDAHLRQDEILFAFRIWREETKSIVGFPGRFHAIGHDQPNAGDVPNFVKWNYNSNYTCELSMVLTGAAFVHKWYMYMYHFWMPQEIRDIVDEYINCEDLALNYLVSHLTRAPPVKVTSRWTFRCPNCPSALSTDESHFQERHRCMNKFTEIYGYNPLLMTQRRSDSVLFKTRLPSTMSKCYKFI